MKIRICSFALVVALVVHAGAEEQIAKLTLEQLTAVPTLAGVQIEARLIDGEPGATITNTNEAPVSVQLAEIPVGERGQAHLSYEARLSSENATKPVYLELWAVVKGEAYFSRALNDAFIGTQPVRESSTPFFLKADEKAESARLGLRFEGPGRVTISGIELWERPAPLGAGLPDNFGGILGSIVGIGSGIWSGVSSYLVARGQARRIVMGVNATCAALGGVMLLTGVALWTEGAAWNLWFAFVLLGIVVTPVYGAMYAMHWSRFQKAEERRMMAMDLM